MRTIHRVCLISIICWSAVFADQITMKDGDRITGSILKKDGDTLTVNSKNFGEIKIKWSDIAEVRSDEPLTIVLPGGQTVKEPLRTENGRIQAGGQTVTPAEVTAVRNEAEQKAY